MQLKINPFTMSAIGSALKNRYDQEEPDFGNIVTTDLEVQKIKEALRASREARKARADRAMLEQKKYQAELDKKAADDIAKANALAELKRLMAEGTPGVPGQDAVIEPAIPERVISEAVPEVPEVKPGLFREVMGDDLEAFGPEVEYDPMKALDNIRQEVLRRQRTGTTKADEAGKFVADLFTVKAHPDTNVAGGWALRIPGETMSDKYIVEQGIGRGLPVTLEMVQKMRKAAQAGAGQQTTPPIFTGEGKAAGGVNPGDGNVLKDFDGSASPPPLPVIGANGKLQWGAGSGAGNTPPQRLFVTTGQPGSPQSNKDLVAHWRKVADDAYAANRKYEGDAASAQAKAAMIIEGDKYGLTKEQRRDMYKEFRTSQPDQWATLGKEIQDSVEAKVKVLGEKINTEKAAKTPAKKEPTIEIKKRWRDLVSKKTAMENKLNAAKRTKDDGVKDDTMVEKVGLAWGDKIPLDVYEIELKKVIAEKRDIESVYGYDAVWKGSGFKYNPYKGKPASKGKPPSKPEPKLTPVDPGMVDDLTRELLKEIKK